MSCKVTEVGYKIVKFGKHVASCSLSCLAPGVSFISVSGVGLIAGIGASVVASAAAAQQSIDRPAGRVLSENIVAGEFDGEGLSGYLITGDSRFSDAGKLTFGTFDAQSLVHNFNTTGGSGSGGGAGLGGVFFVDAGASLTVINVDFKSNRVQGGAGGSDPVLRFSDRSLTITGKATDLPSILTQASFDPASRFTYANDQYKFERLAVSSDVTATLYDGALATFSDYGAFGTIDGVLSSGLVDFGTEGVVINSASVTQLGDLMTSGNLSWGLNSTRDALEIDAAGYAAGNSVDALSSLRIGDYVVAGTSADRAGELGVVKMIEYYSQAEEDEIRRANGGALDLNNSTVAAGSIVGKIKAIRFEDSFATAGYTTLDLIAPPSFQASQFAIDPNNRSIVTVKSPIADFVVGMDVSWEDANGTTVTSKVESVNDDVVTLADPLNAGVTGFSAVLNPIVGTGDSNQVRLENAGAFLTQGQLISVLDKSGVAFTGTVSDIDDATDIVTIVPSAGASGFLSDYYNPAIGLGITIAGSSVVGGGLEVPFDTTGMSPAEIDEIFVGREFDGSDALAGLSVSDVTDNRDGTVTLTIVGGSIDESTPIDYFKLVSPLSLGGSMNGLTTADLRAGAESLEDGERGYSANSTDSFFEDGEGVGGTNGGPAEDPTRGPGANGGDGGNGSDALDAPPFLIYDLAAAYFGVGSATVGTVQAALDLTEALTPDPSLVPAPDPTGVVAKIFGVAAAASDLTFAVADLAFATANMVNWGIRLNEGLAGLGGDGGDGGDASGGMDFFGGGAGGAGGNGGDGVIADVSDGGDGGEGGQGGAGGFGAGGGQGGVGGDGGSTGNAAGGNPGEGGFAGFGAGEGANGDGLFGGGGSGFGGAIFVREGGTLNIQGNALFELNLVRGGTTSSEFGEAGDAAGSDLFIMKGATVRLEPGRGNEIRFEGDIADNSLSTDNGFQNAAGDGADITITGGAGPSGAGGLVVFNGENTYSGNTILEGASLLAELGVGINDDSLIRFNGSGRSSSDVEADTLSLGSVGTLLLVDDYVRRAGTDAAETAWTGSGGFANYTRRNEVVVNLGQLDAEAETGQRLVWGSDGFFAGANGVNSTLTFGSELATSTVRFTNNVDLNGNLGRVAVYNVGASEPLAASQATLSGNWTGGDLSVGSAGSDYTGTLFLTGNNSLGTVGVNSGRLSTYGTASAGSILASTGDLIVLEGSSVDTFGAESFNSATNDGTWNTLGAVSLTGSIVNRGLGFVFGAGATSSTFGGDPFDLAGGLATSGLAEYLPDDFADFNGAISVAGNVNNLGGIFFQMGAATVTGSVSNSTSAIWAGNGRLDVSGDLTNGGTWVQDGHLASDVVSVAGNVNNSYLFENHTLVSVVGAVSNADPGEVFQGADITAQGGVVNNGEWTLIKSATLNAASVGLTGSGVFSLQTPTADEEEMAQAMDLTLSQGGDSTFAGEFTGLGALLKSGSGALTLTGAQTFVGDLNVSAGRVIANNVLADAVDIVVDAGATFDANVTDRVNSVDNSGTFTIAAGTTFTTTGRFHTESPNTLVLRGDLVTLTDDVNNDGRVTVDGDRTITIGTDLEPGLTGAGLTGNGAGDFQISDGGSLTVVQTGVTTYAGSFTRDDSGSPKEQFFKDGAGELTLTGTSYIHVVNVRGGILRIGASNALDDLAAATVSSGAHFIVDASDADTVAHSVTNLVGGRVTTLTALDLGTLDNSGVAAYFANLNLSGRLTNNATTGVLNVAADLTADSLLNNGVISVASGTRTMSLSGDDGLTGTGGFCLETFGDDALCDGAGSSGTRLVLDQAGNSTFDGAFVGLGTVEKQGDGTLTLTAAQSFSGGLFVNDGALVTQASSSAAFHDDLDIVVGVGGALSLNTQDNIGALTVRGQATVNADQIVASATVSGGGMSLNANLTTEAQGALNVVNSGDATGRVSIDGDRVISASGGLSGDGAIELTQNSSLELQQAGAISTFGGTISGETGTALIIDGAERLVLNGSAGQIDVDALTILTGTLVLDGSELLVGTIDVDVQGENSRLELADHSDTDVVRTQTISRLDGSGYIDLGRNTLDVTNGGTFDGEFFGEGSVNVAKGTFTITQSLTSSQGTLDVSNSAGTTVGAGSTVDVRRVQINSQGVLNVAGTDQASSTVTGEEVMVQSGGRVHLGDGAYNTGDENNTVLQGNKMGVHGTVGGNGTLSADTIRVESDVTTTHARVQPGDSPGVLQYDAVLTTFGFNSVHEIEVIDTDLADARNGYDQLAAGTGYDQLRFTAGTRLNLEENAALEIADLNDPGVGESFDPNNYSLGERTRIMSFDPLAVTGTFGSVEHTNSINGNEFVLNLATGTLVGLGNRDLSEVAVTENQLAMLSDLMVEDNGGVEQYYGGRFVENLTEAWARGADTGEVFDRASPEIYSALGGGAQEAASNVLPAWKSGYIGEVGSQASFVNVSRSVASADDASGEHMRFGVTSTVSSAGLSMTSSDLTLMVGFGAAQAALSGDYFVANGSGVAAAVGLVGAIPGASGAFWNVALSHADLDFDGTRNPNNGSVRFDNVGAQATELSVGAEFRSEGEAGLFGARLGILAGSARSSSFSEAAAAGNVLDAMSVGKVSYDYTRLELGLELGTEVREGTNVFASLDGSAPLGGEHFGLVGAFDAGQGVVGVQSHGLSSVSASINLGIDQRLSETGVLRFEVGGNEDWAGDTEVSTKLSVQFTF